MNDEKEPARRRSGGRAVQTEGIVNAKAMRQGYAWHVEGHKGEKFGWNEMSRQES